MEKWHLSKATNLKGSGAGYICRQVIAILTLCWGCLYYPPDSSSPYSVFSSHPFLIFSHRFHLSLSELFLSWFHSGKEIIRIPHFYANLLVYSQICWSILQTVEKERATFKPQISQDESIFRIQCVLLLKSSYHKHKGQGFHWTKFLLTEYWSDWGMLDELKSSLLTHVRGSLLRLLFCLLMEQKILDPW